MAAILWWFKIRSRWLKSRGFEWWAKMLTISYLSLFLGVATARIQELVSLPLNELGDFAAGVFGPLAFLWLVLGYRQQGKELSASTAAMEAQAAELKSTLDLQKELSNKQDLLIDPILVISYERPAFLGEKRARTLSLQNSGDTCRHVRLKFKSRMHRKTFFFDYFFHVLKANEPALFTVEAPDDFEDMDILITYLRANGSHGSQNFTYKVAPGRIHIMPELPDNF